MRILFLTNYYPPFEPGGQGQSVMEIVAGLSARGHECAVLTSMHGTHNRPEASGGVHRRLFLEMDSTRLAHSLVFFTSRKRREAHNLREFDRLAAEFRPDAVLVCGMWNLPRSLPALAERRLPGKVAYRFAEYWPTLPTQHEMYWRAPPRSRLTGIPKAILGRIALALLAREGPPPALKFEHACCVSAGTREALVDAGVPVGHARVIHTGLDFPAAERVAGSTPGGPLHLLYAGRLEWEKGVDTVIEALAELDGRPDENPFPVRLRIAGAGREQYEQELRRRVSELHLDRAVEFLGRRPPAEMPALMGGCDVLVVPSRWPEPFARVVLEGMHSGLAIVATCTGGTAEIVEDGVNGLLFPPGDHAALAALLRTLIADPARRSALAEAGRETVKNRYSRTAMLDAYEAFLAEAAAGPRGG